MAQEIVAQEIVAPAIPEELSLHLSRMWGYSDGIEVLREQKKVATELERAQLKIAKAQVAEVASQVEVVKTKMGEAISLWLQDGSDTRQVVLDLSSQRNSLLGEEEKRQTVADGIISAIATKAKPFNDTIADVRKAMVYHNGLSRVSYEALSGVKITPIRVVPEDVLAIVNAPKKKKA